MRSGHARIVGAGNAGIVNAAAEQQGPLQVASSLRFNDRPGVADQRPHLPAWYWRPGFVFNQYAEQSMYQLIHGSLFAQRLDDGSVHLLHLREVPPSWPRAGQCINAAEVLASLEVPAAVWPALVAAVSACGHTAAGFYEAQAFHNRPAAPAARPALGEPSVEMRRRREDGEEPPQPV